MFPKNHIYNGDAYNTLLTFPDESVDCVVTSPPYFGLRDYGIPGTPWPAVWYAPMAGMKEVLVEEMIAAHGLEREISDFIGHEVLIMRQIRRVLKPQGTLWLNMGDSYCAGKTGSGSEHTIGAGGGRRTQREAGKRPDKFPAGLKRKDLLMIPARLALALQADGWYLRSDIIWHKDNPMPESVADRPTKSHEHLFLLSKQEKYYYDADAIREKFTQEEMANGFRGGAYCNNSTFDNAVGDKRTAAGNYKVPAGWDTSAGAHGSFHKSGRNGISKEGYTGRSDGLSRPPTTMKDREYHPLGRNKRDVWIVSTQPYKKAHFATFPPDLIKPCILAGCPQGGVVLDPFGGSGTTAMVARKLMRNCILIEIKEEYVRLAEDRNRQMHLVEV